MANATSTRLLRVATKEFAQHGYDGTTIDVIADKLGVTGGALYRYVASKQELFSRCYEQCDRVWHLRVVDKVNEAEGAEERFKTLFRSMARLAIEQPEAMLLLGQSRSHLPLKTRRRYGQNDKDQVKFMQDVVADFIEFYSLDKSISPLLALYVMQGMIIWIARWYTPHGEADVERLLDEMMYLLLHGLYGTDREGDTERAHYDFTRRHVVNTARPTASRRESRR
jgi:AcrR family transcriptional regulator